MKKKSIATKVIKKAQEKYAVDALTKYSNMHGEEDLDDNILMMLQSALNARVVTSEEEAAKFIMRAIEARDATPESIESKIGKVDEDILKNSDVTFGTGKYGG